MNSVSLHAGSPAFTGPSDDLDAARQRELNDALAALSVGKRTWVATSVSEQLTLIDEIIGRVALAAEEWTELSAAGKRGADQPEVRASERFMGPLLTIRYLQLLRRALRDIEISGRPRLRGLPRVGRSGRTTVPVFPAMSLDPVLIGPGTAEVWLRAGVTPHDLPALHEQACRPTDPLGHLKLILGAGNLGCIAVADALEAIFGRGEAALVKLNPVNEYLLPVFGQIFTPLRQRGVLRFVTGGAVVGEYLCAHPEVQSVHVTGSDKTFDAVVFGPGVQGAERKARRDIRLKKPITAELGGVSPTIVVPGPWSARDLAYAAHSVAFGLTNNAGFNCATTRLLVQHASWPQRGAFLTALQHVLGRIRTQAAHYPGAEDRWQRLVAQHPQARQIGTPDQGHLPWTLALDVDPEGDDPSFSAEAFCSFAAETALQAPDPAGFLDRAVEFVNERVFGSLNATLLVHPASLRDEGTRAAVERAVATLRYGTVGVNAWSGFGFLMCTTPWGAYPGNDPFEVGSGIGMSRNTLRLPEVEKTVLRAPFRTVPPPACFPLFGRPDETTRLLLPLMLNPSPKTFLPMALPVLRGWL